MVQFSLRNSGQTAYICVFVCLKLFTKHILHCFLKLNFKIYYFYMQCMCFLKFILKNYFLLVKSSLYMTPQNMGLVHTILFNSILVLVFDVGVLLLLLLLFLGLCSRSWCWGSLSFTKIVVGIGSIRLRDLQSRISAWLEPSNALEKAQGPLEAAKERDTRDEKACLHELVLGCCKSSILCMCGADTLKSLLRTRDSSMQFVT